MNITNKCYISGSYGFDLNNSNKFVIIELEGKNDDLIHVNQINGLKFNEIFTAYEHPYTEEHPIIDNQNKIIILGGEEKKTKRTLLVIGK